MSSYIIYYVLIQREAGCLEAHTVMIKSGSSSPGRVATEADAETVSILVEVIAFMGSGKRILVELNDMTLGEQVRAAAMFFSTKTKNDLSIT